MFFGNIPTENKQQKEEKSGAKKGAEAFSGLVRSTRDFGKKAADSAKNGVSAMVERSKSESYARRLKKYNPIFPEQYLSEGFNLPNMIMIVDDAVRRDIDVCEGAIGWLGKDSGMEVLYLYDEAVDFSGIQFVPMVTCDAVYYVDSFDRNRFIRTDCIFSKAHEERLAELKNIAYLLGARRCVIEIEESSEMMKEIISGLHSLELNEEEEKEVAEAVERTGKGSSAEFCAKVIVAITESLPDLALALMTGGGSTAATAAKGIKKVWKSTATNPNFWYAAETQLYPIYREALADGATEDEALRTALGGAPLSAGLEGNLGFEKYIKSNVPMTWKQGLGNYIKAGALEGAEEAVKNAAPEVVEKWVFDPSKPLLKAREGEEAVLNLSEAVMDFLIGGAGGLVSSTPRLFAVGRAGETFREFV